MSTRIRSKQSKARTYKQQKQKQQARRNILLIIGGVVVLALIAVVALVLANNNRPGNSTAVGSFTTVDKKEWPKADGTALGDANAPVVISEFADYQCPFCKQFNQTVQGQIIDQYVKTGKARYEFHNFIVIDQNVGGTESLHAAMAAMCANEQGQFWNFHDMLYANQGTEGGGSFSDARLKAFAKALGLDTAKFNSCFDSQKYASKITQDQALGTTLGIQGTPSLFVNNKLVTNPMDLNAIKAAVDAAAAGK